MGKVVYYGSDDVDRVSFRKLGSTRNGATAYRRGRPKKSKGPSPRPWNWKPVTLYFVEHDYPYHGWLTNP